ncbi:hypothetical protein HS041_22490 [Planomonospora sp. ID67723]|uniref:hypothetical protein n=1 Tax=Planomonospora sp. ID67723 TaxID=2738134 RepID=UPI0018C3B819|nr:hypothetical protein [Planomonospora sp. ID67723]MBG0830534.1 hypothetical protein [Planomonospora sp. ID67723]
MFAQPSAPGSDFKVSDYVGHLFLIYPRELRQGIVTSNGPADAISADLVLLTDPNGPRAETGVLIFQKMLIGSLKGKIGADPVLGRLARGVAKPGQTAPYVLNPFDDNDAAYATQYLNSVGGNPFPQAAPFTAPAPAPQAAPVAPLPQAAPVPQQAAAAYPAPAYPAPAPAPQAAPVPVPVGAGTAEAQAAAAALGMQLPPAAPGM